MADLEILSQKIKLFAEERDWDQFHSPKNLSMALAGEVGELLEHFQWLSEEESASLNTESKSEVAQELADILIYLVRLADKLEIDLVAAAEDKILLNAEKYPIPKSKGNSKKYDKL